MKHKYILLTCVATLTTACDLPEDTRTDPDALPWQLSDALEQRPIEPADPGDPTDPSDPSTQRPDDPAGELIEGYWIGAQNIGGCIDSVMWWEYTSDGLFSQNVLENNQCIPEEERGLFSCVGEWESSNWTDETKRTGQMDYSCAATHESTRVPKAISTSSPYHIIEDSQGKSLTQMVLSWSNDGSLRRYRTDRITYAPNQPGGRDDESITTTSTSLFLTRPDGEMIDSIDALDELAALQGGGMVRLQAVLLVDAMVSFSLTGETASGLEGFDLGVRVTKEDSRYTLEFELGAGGWSGYLGDQGVFERHPAAAGAFVVAFTDTFYIDSSSPTVAWAPANWRHQEDACWLSHYPRVDLPDDCDP